MPCRPQHSPVSPHGSTGWEPWVTDPSTETQEPSSYTASSEPVKCHRCSFYWIPHFQLDYTEAISCPRINQGPSSHHYSENPQWLIRDAVPLMRTSSLMDTARHISGLVRKTVCEQLELAYPPLQHSRGTQITQVLRSLVNHPGRKVPTIPPLQRLPP